MTISTTYDPLAYDAFGQDPLPTAFVPENPFDYARVIVDSAGNSWLLGNLQLPLGGTVYGYAPSDLTAGVSYVPWVNDPP